MILRGASFSGCPFSRLPDMPHSLRDSSHRRCSLLLTRWALDTGRTTEEDGRALALEAFGSTGCPFRRGLGSNRFCSSPSFYRQTTFPLNTIILQTNVQGSRWPSDWKWVFSKFPRGGLGRVLLLHINPPTLQRWPLPAALPGEGLWGPQ